MADNPKPRRQIPYSPTEVATEIVSAAALVYVVTVFLGNWHRLPAIVPTHFGFSGKPDAIGPKQVLIIIPVVMAILYALLTVARQFPYLSNFMVPITEENAERQYRLVASMLSWMKVEIMCLFAYMTSATIQVALGHTTGLGALVLPVFMVILFGTLAIYLVRSVRGK